MSSCPFLIYKHDGTPTSPPAGTTFQCTTAVMCTMEVVSQRMLLCTFNTISVVSQKSKDPQHALDFRSGDLSEGGQRALSRRWLTCLWFSWLMLTPLTSTMRSPSFMPAASAGLPGSTLPMNCPGLAFSACRLKP